MTSARRSHPRGGGTNDRSGACVPELPALTRRGARLALPVALLWLLVATGCSTPPQAAPVPVEPGSGVAFGAFDFRASDITATHVVLVRINPTKVYMGGAGERSTITFTEGQFYAPDLSPGVYAVNAFYSGDLRVALEGNLRGNTFRVEPGGVAYAGSYRVTYARKGVFRRDEASFERVDSKAAETQLLRWLASEPSAAAWADRVRGRMTALERN